MSPNSIAHIANIRKNIIFVKRNDKNNTSNDDMQKISDVSAGVASIMWDSMKMRNLFSRLPSIWMLVLVGSQSSF